MITIYYYHIQENAHAALLEKYLPTFPEKFQERILRFRNWQDAQLSLSGRLLLQHALKKHTNLNNFNWDTLQYDSYGKPYINNHKLHFNISHSGTIVAIAVSTEVKIGIDLEKIAPIEIIDFKPQMTPSEWEHVDKAQNKSEAFYNYWTKKEAVIKIDGRGMSIPLLSFEVVDDLAVINSEKYYTKKIPLAAGYAFHIASDKKIASEEIYIENIQNL